MNRITVADQVRVLMFGYNGANNTGAEALLQTDIEDVRAALGTRASITVPTLNESNLRRYLSDSDDLRIVPIPSLFFKKVRRLVEESDIVMLVEGSTYMDTWGSPLLWAFLWATHCAAKLGKDTVAYAVDAGRLSVSNQRRVRRIASRTGLIVTRTRAAAERLRAIGVEAPIEWTADNAFVYEPRVADLGWPGRSWPAAQSGVVGIAAVDYTRWPAVLRAWGPKGSCYRWPYYFSRSSERLRQSTSLAEGYARLADRIISRRGQAVALICMEQLDEDLANQIRLRMKHPDRARIFSARDYDASLMTVLLRSLTLLVTSRFHAAVLSLAAPVPQIAVGHDLRLRTLYEDLGLSTDWFLDPRANGENGVTMDPGLVEKLWSRIERLLADPAQQATALSLGYRLHLDRARRNRGILADYLRRCCCASDCEAREQPDRPAMASGGGVR